MDNKTFLTDTQAKELNAKDWKVNSKGAYLTLYADDFETLDSWEQICQQLGLDSDTGSVEVLYFGIKADNSL